jgi:hypothetical protein
MCQMCDEYENELVRMGLIEDAKKFREERARVHEAAVGAAAGHVQMASRSEVKKIAPKAPVY